MANSIINWALPIAVQGEEDSIDDPLMFEHYPRSDGKKCFSTNSSSKISILLHNETDNIDIQSFLYQIAITAASIPNAQRVHVLSQKPFDQKRPKVVQDMSELTFQSATMMKFLYPKDLSDINLYLSSLGSSAKRIKAQAPKLLIINELQDFCNVDLTEKFRQFTKILSLLNELDSVFDKAVISWKIAPDDHSSVKDSIFQAKLHFFANEVWFVDEEQISSPEDTKKYVIDYVYDDDNMAMEKAVEITTRRY